MKKNIVYILLFVGLILGFETKVNSLTYGGCEYSEISRLKSIVSNVNITYDYYILNNEAYFNVTLTNITPDIYIVDATTNLIYGYNNTVDGEITIYNYKIKKGHYKFYSALDKCYGIKLSDKYYKFPIYNQYYTDEICIQNSNNSLCQKWANITYSYNEFKQLIDKHNEQKNEQNQETNIVYEKTLLNKIVDFYTKYYYIILIGIIGICIIVMIVNNKKNKFDI